MPATLRRPQTFWTVGRICTQLNEPLHRVEYAIKSRGIEPVGTAGNARVFEADQVEVIASALREMDARREGTR
jgi:hypothetical protein